MTDAERSRDAVPAHQPDPAPLPAVDETGAPDVPPESDGRPGTSVTVEQTSEAGDVEPAEGAPSAQPETPSIARRVVTSVLSRQTRFWLLVGTVVVSGIYLFIGPIQARNVTFNISDAIDSGATTGLPRFIWESPRAVWSVMIDRAPVFGSELGGRLMIVTPLIVFVIAAIATCYLAFIPSEAEWVSDLDADPAASRKPRD